MEDNKVQKLAATLRERGLAVSMYEALEKAKSIMNIKSEKNENQEETKQAMPEARQEPEALEGQDKSKWQSGKFNVGHEVRNEKATLNELMQEVGVEPEQVQTMEREKVEKIKEEISEIKEDMNEVQDYPEKAEQIREDILKVNEQVNEIAEIKSEEAENKPEEIQQINEPEPQQINEPIEEEKANELQQDNEPEQETQEKKEDEFKDEKKIDLTKVFNYKK